MVNSVILLLLIVGLCDCGVILHTFELAPQTPLNEGLTPRKANIVLEFDPQDISKRESVSERMTRYSEMDEFFQDTVDDRDREEPPLFDDDMAIVPGADLA